MDLVRSSKISTIVILITITLILVATVTSSWATNTKDPRDLGGMVTINGEERPDLIEHFDFLRQKTIMIKGKVFAKDEYGNPNTPKALNSGIHKGLGLGLELKKIELEKIEEDRVSREKLVLKNPQNKGCWRCQGCGKVVNHGVVRCEHNIRWECQPKCIPCMVKPG